jgi:hypothetical protein
MLRRARSQLLQLPQLRNCSCYPSAAGVGAVHTQARQLPQLPQAGSKGSRLLGVLLLLMWESYHQLLQACQHRQTAEATRTA